MEKNKKSLARKISKIIMWAFLVLVILFIILVIVRVFHFVSLDKTNAEVAKIKNTKLTIDDVLGKNLPADPGALADQTIAGIDANKNGIRDDVEIAIFQTYPNSAKTRAVLLQYALALQTQMTLPVLNTTTLTTTVQDNLSRAEMCLWNLSSRSDMNKFITDVDKYQTYVENLQINTPKRKKYMDDLYKYLRSYSASNEGCDLDLTLLSN